MSRTQRATWTYGTNVIFTLVTMVTGLYASPRITEWMGGEVAFGYYKTASDLGGFIPLLELGISGGIMAMLSRAVGRGDQAEIRATLAAGVRLAGRVCFLMLAAGWALVFVFPHLQRFRLPPIAPAYLRDVQVGFALSMLGCLTFPLQPFRALMEARQRGYLINTLIIAQTLSVTGLAMLFAYGGGGITGQFLAYLVGALAVPFLIAWQGVRQYPGVLREAASRPIPEDLRQSLWSLNRASMILNVCGRLSIYSDSLLIFAILGKSALVAQVAFTSSLAGMAKNQLLAVGTATWAGLSEIRLRGDHDLFARRLFELNRLLAILGLTVLLPISAYNRDFMGLWFRRIPMYAGDAVTLVIAANALLLPFASLWGWVFQGMGRSPRLVRTTILATALNITTSIVATHALGAVGPLLGTLTAFVLYQSWKIPLILRDEFGLPLRGLARATLPALLLGIPCGAAVWGLARAFPAHGWLGLAFRMSVTATIYPTLAWFLVMDGGERATWKGRARSILARFLPVPEAAPIGHPETRSDGGLIDVEGVEGVETVEPDGPGAVDDDLPVSGPVR